MLRLRLSLGIIGLSSVLLAGPVAAQKVTIDYAKNMNFRAVKSFEYVPSEDRAVKNQIMDDRIVQLMKERLTDNGLMETGKNPDIYVTYHLTTEQNQVFDTTSFGYGGFGPGWGPWGGGISTATTTASTYTAGTLIFDAYRPEDHKLVWRGTGTVTVASKPEKQTKQVKKIIDKLGDRWQRILRNEGN